MSVRRQSLARKLIALVMIAVTAGMAVSALLSTWQEIGHYAETRRQVMLTTARIFASAAASSVAQGKQQETIEAIRAIGQVPGFQFVQVRTPDGGVLAALGSASRLVNDPSMNADETPSIFDLLRGGTILISVPVIDGGREVGQINLIADITDFWPRLQSSLWLVLLTAAAALVVALVIAWRFQRAITQPLRRLLAAMQAVQKDQRYDVKVEEAKDQEIGLLVDGFNTMLGAIRDRDDRLIDYQRSLEQKVVERTQELAQARDAAETANRAKSDFLATMSHEIRTPMNGIMVMADLLATSEMPRRQHRYAEVIARSGRTLLSIINDILDFSKIEAGKLELERGEVCIDEVVENVTSLFAERASSQNIDLAASISPDVPRTISGDPVRLGQVIGNLINNALKFTERGFVRLKIKLCPTDAGQLELSVEDTGIGIPQDKLATIFESFSQADQSTTRKFGGTGLGLAICRRIVAAMGGIIDVSSQVGVGSTFRVRIPIDGATSRPWPRVAMTPTAQPACIVDVAGEATAAALSNYLAAFGCLVQRTDSQASRDDRSAVMVFVDADRFRQTPLAKSAGRIVIVVTPFGDASADELIASGAADAALSRPLLRSEVEDLLRRIVAGKDALQSQPLGRRVTAAIPRFTNLRVLVADDSAVNREVATEALTRLGAHVETVDNGIEAVRVAARRSHDVIFMDGSMPELDGFAAARLIRQAEHSENRTAVRIIALTAHVVGEAADEWRRSGMDGVVHKPFTIAQLGQCLAELVPEFQSGVAEPIAANESVPATVEAQSRLIDAGTLAQLRALTAAKKGDFLKRVVDLYSEHAPAACSQLREKAEAGDAEACGALAHSLKSMSLNIGAFEVAKIAAAIEQMTRGECKVPDRDQLDVLSDTLDRTLSALAHELGEGAHDNTGLAPAVGRPNLQGPSDDDFASDLHRAIERGELDVLYQPVVDRAGSQVLSVEALVRWRRGGEDVAMPSAFVPLAERTGFIHDLGEWVLRRACHDALAWPELPVAVNVSPTQFGRSSLADRIERIMTDAGTDPRRIELEITETAMIESEAAVLATIEQLRERGVSFALDDFGTGFSSLTNLRRFPVNKIKIDRSFISNVGVTVDATIIHAVVSIGRVLGLKVVAEGVETAEQQRFVAAAGAHGMQGFLFAPPLQSSDVASFVAAFNNRVGRAAGT